MFVSPYRKIYSIHLGCAGHIHGACSKHLSKLTWIQQASAGHRGFHRPSWIQTFLLRREQILPRLLPTIFLTNAVSPINCESKLWWEKLNISLVSQVSVPTIMSGLFISTKLKNCNFFSLRDWTWNTFKAGGGDGVVFGDCFFFFFVRVDDEAGWKPLSGECKALKLFTDAKELRSETEPNEQFMESHLVQWHEQSKFDK